MSIDHIFTPKGALHFSLLKPTSIALAVELFPQVLYHINFVLSILGNLAADYPILSLFKHSHSVLQPMLQQIDSKELPAFRRDSLQSHQCSGLHCNLTKHPLIFLNQVVNSIEQPLILMIVSHAFTRGQTISFTIAAKPLQGSSLRTLVLRAFQLQSLRAILFRFSLLIFQFTNFSNHCHLSLFHLSVLVL